MAKSSFVVQSGLVASSLSKQLLIRSSSIRVADIECMSRMWHPLLGTRAIGEAANSCRWSSGIALNSINLQIESILERGFSRIVFSCCSPRSHKNPWLIYEVARKVPSVAFVCTLPPAFFDEGLTPLNLFAIGPLPHAHALSWIAHKSVSLTFFPSLMETYGLPIVESAILRKPCAIPSEDFFEVHTSSYAVRYSAADSDDAADLILALCH